MMAETVTNLVSEAKRNKFSQINRLNHDGEVFNPVITSYKLCAAVL